MHKDSACRLNPGLHPTRGSAGAIAPSVRAVAASGVAGFIARHGGSPQAVLRRAQLEAEALSQPLNPLPLASYCALFEEAARQTGMESFGLRFGLESGAGALGEVGALALAAPTLDAACAALCRFFPALQEQSTLALRREGRFAVLSYQIRDGRIVHRRQDAELTIGVLVSILRRVLGEEWAPDEVHFEHARPADRTDHLALLRAPICFSAPANAILFRPGWLAAAMPPAGGKVAASVLAGRLAERAAEAQPDDLVGQVQQVIRASLISGDAGLRRVAHALGTSEPSLYRLLRQRGVEFSELSRGLRRELALAHVAEPHLAFTEIALLLGYSELSAFSRAFRGWTGLSPAYYRRHRSGHVRPAR